MKRLEFNAYLNSYPTKKNAIHCFASDWDINLLRENLFHIHCFLSSISELVHIPLVLPSSSVPCQVLIAWSISSVAFPIPSAYSSPTIEGLRAHSPFVGLLACIQWIPSHSLIECGRKVQKQPLAIDEGNGSFFSNEKVLYLSQFFEAWFFSQLRNSGHCLTPTQSSKFTFIAPTQQLSGYQKFSTLERSLVS